MLSALLTGTLALELTPRTPHAKLVFVRHGQSTWNKLNLFTGWKDVEVCTHALLWSACTPA